MTISIVVPDHLSIDSEPIEYKRVAIAVTTIAPQPTARTRGCGPCERTSSMDWISWFVSTGRTSSVLACVYGLYIILEDGPANSYRERERFVKFVVVAGCCVCWKCSEKCSRIVYNVLFCCVVLLVFLSCRSDSCGI